MVELTDFPAYSIALYGLENVEENCLMLQDRYGLDVNAVLFCFWFAAHQGEIGEDLWRRIDGISRQWQDSLVRPLRQARRWLKDPDLELDQQKQDLRERIKTDEIAAELLQQRMMQEACEGCEAGAPAEAAEAARRNAGALLQRRDIVFNGEIGELLAAISGAAFP